MKTFFYSTKEFERPWLERTAGVSTQWKFEKKDLTLQTVSLARGSEAISIFTNDDASSRVLAELKKAGIHYITTRAAGHDNIDLSAAANLGIKVANVPAYSPYAIAEHAVALLLALNRKLIRADRQVHQHDFRVDNLVGFDLNNKTTGIIGTGRIGAVFAGIMHGFGCRLLGYDIKENNRLTEKYDLQYMDLESLCCEADVISIHTGLNPGTHYLLNKELINVMKKGVIIINTGRGACVNTHDIIAGLESGRIGYYGADVYEKEKGIFFYNFTGKETGDPLLDKLLSFPNVLITPHQAFATDQALTNIAQTTFHNLQCWEKGEETENELTHTVNIREAAN